MNSRAANKGFTLVEMVLAIGLAISLMGSMLWFYRYTAQVRDDVSQRIQEIGAQRRVMDQITVKLRGAMMYPFLNLGLEGQTDQVTFMTTALPDRSVWAVQDVTEKPRSPQQDVRMVSYGLRLVEDEQNKLIIEGLETSEQELFTAVIQIEVQEGEQEQDPEGTAQKNTILLSPYLYFVRFRYWDGSVWLDVWPPEGQPTGGLPQAVEIALGEQALPEGVEPIDYPYELSTRVVYLPAAVKVQTGNIIRGLSGGG